MQQVASSSDGRNRGLPATIVKSVQSAKKPGLQPPLNIKMEVGLLHCPLCSRPLKPPVFQCMAGHLACGGCSAEQCRTCGGGGFDVRNTAMDAVVSSATVVCPHDGCGTYVAYHELAGHRSTCPHAPCSCTEPGCGFVALPPTLVRHLAAVHSMPVHKFRYGKDFLLQVPASGLSRRLLVGEDDGCAFLLTVGAAATAVTIVCIRASAAPQPKFTCKMWSILKPSQDVVLLRTKVTSSTSPGEVAAASFLTVPPEYLVGFGAFKNVHLNIRIQKIQVPVPI